VRVRGECGRDGHPRPAGGREGPPVRPRHPAERHLLFRLGVPGAAGRVPALGGSGREGWLCGGE